MSETRTRKKAAALQRQCDQWNAKHPVGTPVKVRLDLGMELDTVTASAAEMLGGHTPVIWLDGVRGCYLLDRVRPVERAQ